MATNNNGPRCHVSHRPKGGKVNSFNRTIHHIEPQRKDERMFTREVCGDLGHVPGEAPVEVPKLLGSDLTPADFAALEARWIDRGLAERAQLRRADALTGAEVIGRKSGNYAGIIIPYFYPGSDQVREYRLRRDQPDLEYDAAGNLKPRQKYLSPPGRDGSAHGERKYGKARRIWVFDRGIASEENLAAIRKREGQYLTGTSRSQMKQFEAELLKGEWTQVRSEVEIKKVSIPQGEETYILCRTSGQGKREGDPKSIFQQHGDRAERSGKSHRPGAAEGP
jgi:hypothetical protein